MQLNLPDLDWERISLMLVFIGFSIYAFLEVDREQRKSRPTHRYNRDTGKVERIDD